jgi:hypothetical protein
MVYTPGPRPGRPLLTINFLLSLLLFAKLYHSDFFVTFGSPVPFMSFNTFHLSSTKQSKRVSEAMLLLKETSLEVMKNIC